MNEPNEWKKVSRIQKSRKKRKKIWCVFVGSNWALLCGASNDVCNFLCVRSLCISLVTCADWVGLNDIVCNANIVTSYIVDGSWHIDRSVDLACSMASWCRICMRIQQFDCKAPHIFPICTSTNFRLSSMWALFPIFNLIFSNSTKNQHIDRNAYQKKWTSTHDENG